MVRCSYLFVLPTKANNSGACYLLGQSHLRVFMVLLPLMLLTKTVSFNIIYLFIFSGFEDVFLSGFRALSEQQPIAEDYSSFK